MRTILLTGLIVIAAVTVARAAGSTQDQQIIEHNYYLMENYRLRYSPDVFDYCVSRHGSVARTAGACMMKQDRQKQRALQKALEQLGKHSLAQAVYDDCLDYYPVNSAVRVSKCVYTRLDLNLMLDDDTAEQEIYHFCDVKWRNHGYLSIENCTTVQARYYLRTGEYRN